MTTDRPDNRTDASGTWVWAALGVLAIAALIAAIVWVVQGQVQQAQVLRAQWQGPPRALQLPRAELGLGAAAGQPGTAAKLTSPASTTSPKSSTSANGIMAASFDSP